MESLVVGNRDISLGVGILPSYHRLENDIVPLLVTVINVTNTSIHISPDVFTLVDTHGNSHAPIPMGDLSVIYPSYTFENRYLESSEFSRIFIAHVDQTIPTLFYPPVGNLIVDNVDLDYGHRMVDMLYFQVPAVDSEGVYTLSLYIGRGFPSLEVRFPIPAFSGKKKDRR